MDPETIVRYLRASLAGAWIDAVAGGSAGAHAVERPGVRAAVCPAAPDGALVNCVVAASAAPLEAAYDELAEHYAACGVRGWSVFVTEGDDPSAGVLGSRGHLIEAVPRAMGRELHDLPPARAGLDLDDAVSPETVGAINDRADDDEPLPMWEPALTRYPPTADLLAARAGGEPVACAFVLDGGVDAHVSGVATLPEHRGRGLARGIVLHLLHRARARGRTTTTLIASSAGAPVYAALGYEDAGAIEMWALRR